MKTPAVLQIVGYKNTGKTTLVCRLIKLLSESGYKIGTIKHDGHDFEIDHAGTDTWRHTLAGATMTAITSSRKTAIIEQSHTTLSKLIERMKKVDIILVEGFKSDRYPKIVLLRSEDQMEIVSKVSNVMAIASWFPMEHPTYPVCPIDDIESISKLLIQTVVQRM